MNFWRFLLGFILVFIQFISYGQQNPVPHRLSSGPYSFSYWDVDAGAGTYPNSMVFLQYNLNSDPKVDDEPADLWRCSYNQDSRSRFMGLGEDGVGMVNTSGTLDDPSRCNNGQIEGGRVGAVLLALDTRNVFDIRLDWKVRLIQQGGGLPLPREYRILAEYRTDTTGDWKPFPISSGYTSKGKVSGQVNTYSIILPKECENHSLVQIRWRYFQENGNDGGSRPMIALDDVRVVGADAYGNYAPSIITSRNSLPVIGCVAGRGDAFIFFDWEALHVKDTTRLVAPSGFYLSNSPNGNRADTLTFIPENGFIAQNRIYVFYECSEAGAKTGRLRIETPEVSLIQIQVSGESYPVLYINEVMASNFNAYRDPLTKQYHDWIEIYNPNDFEVSLNGYHMSDNPAKLNKYRIPFRNLPNRIPPRSYKIYWASSDSTNKTNHLNFSLSIYGETIFLVGKDGRTIIDSLSFSKQVANFSYGRLPDGGMERGILESPTPEKTNNITTYKKERSQPPIFNMPGGFYSDSLMLEILKPTSDAVIYYTLDGSDPRPENISGVSYNYLNEYPFEIASQSGPMLQKSFNSYIYDAPMILHAGLRKPDRITGINTQYTRGVPFIQRRQFNDAIVVKAVCHEPGKELSEIVTNTYFLDHEQHFKGQLPVVSISTQEDRLFDFDKGLYVAGVDFVNWRARNDSLFAGPSRPANYRRRGRSAEVPAHLEVFEENTRMLSMDLGIRIHGNWSRAARIKSLRLYARNYYGENQIRHSFFKDRPYGEFERLLLRNSGEDNIRTRFKDGFIQTLFDKLNVDNQAFNPYHVFLNGEYWGILNARERQDFYYLQRKYGITNKNVELIQNNNVALEGSIASYRGLMEFVMENDLSVRDNYEFVINKFDIEDLQNYIISKFYTACTDWPNNNIKAWRYISDDFGSNPPYGLDGKWRWLYFDYDSGFQLKDVNLNSFAWVSDPTKTAIGNIYIRKLLQNIDFRVSFIQRICDHLNSYYKAERVNQLLDEFHLLLKDDMPYHIDRWSEPATLNFWNGYIRDLRSFANQRPTNMRNHLRSYYGLSSDIKVTVDVDSKDKGLIKVNTIVINEELPGVSDEVYPWVGTYFRNFPLRLLPLPEEGFKFSYWETKDSLIYRDTLTIQPRGDFYIKAYFEPDTAYKYFPEPYKLAGCPYRLEEWSQNNQPGKNPSNMAFINVRNPDSGLNGIPTTYLDSIRYDHSARTRINGLGERGIAFINSNEANRNYQPCRLGGAILALNTEGVERVEVKWTGATIKPGSKEYNIRLQYRIGEKGNFKDLLDDDGKPVEYKRSDIPGHKQELGPVKLPSDAMGKKCVQLFWRYYYSNKQNDPSSDTRDQLALDDILIRQLLIKGAVKTGTYTSNLIGADGSLSYQWFKCEDGIPIPIEGAQSSTLEIRKAGVYALAVEYDQCRDTSACEYFFVKEYRESPSSISFIVYPNPTESVFSINFGGLVKSAFIYLVDVSGKVVKDLSFTNDYRQTIDIKSLPAGYYNIIVETDDGRRGYAPVVKI